jgi:hypothetical protein
MKMKAELNNDYKVGQKVLLRKEGILRNTESIWHKKPWLITTVHTNGAIGKCRKPPRNVSYKHTFGAPDQGQMLDV